MQDILSLNASNEIYSIHMLSARFGCFALSSDGGPRLGTNCLNHVCAVLVAPAFGAV